MYLLACDHHAPGATTSRGWLSQELPWDHSFIRELPGDTDNRNVVRQVTGALYSRVEPTPAAGEPRTLSYSPQVRVSLREVCG
jgi:hypothetical protein